jgi:hypothetical protein
MKKSNPGRSLSTQKSDLIDLFTKIDPNMFNHSQNCKISKKLNKNKIIKKKMKPTLKMKN